MIHISPLEKVGLEFSDTTLRFIRLKKQREIFVPIDFAEIAIPQGCVRDGKITNRAVFIKFLTQVKKNHAISSAYIALPSSAMKLVSGLVDGATGVATATAIRQLLETKTSLDIKDLVSAKRLVLHTKKGRFMQLLAASTAVTQEFLTCFIQAGITPLSFEHQAQAQCAAILTEEDVRPIMMVRIDEHQTILSIVVQGSVVDTSTLDEGSVSTSIRATGQHSLSLVTAINNYYIQWHNTKAYAGIFEAVKMVYLTGAGAAIEGYADFMSSILKLPVVVSNTWSNCFSFETIIPKLTRVESLRYATVVGLALGGGTLSVLPQAHKKQLKRKKIWHKTRFIATSFLLGAVAGFLTAYALYYFDVRWITAGIVELLHKI